MLLLLLPQYFKENPLGFKGPPVWRFHLWLYAWMFWGRTFDSTVAEDAFPSSGGKFQGMTQSSFRRNICKSPWPDPRFFSFSSLWFIHFNFMIFLKHFLFSVLFTITNLMEFRRHYALALGRERIRFDCLLMFPDLQILCLKVFSFGSVLLNRSSVFYEDYNGLSMNLDWVVKMGWKILVQ